MFTRIARTLHDDLGQTLMILNLHLHWVSRHCADEQRVNDRISEMQEIIGYTNRTVRRLMQDCRPLQCPADTTINDTAHALIEQFECESGITCRLHLPDHPPALDRDYVIAVARILHGILAGVQVGQPVAGLTIWLECNPEGIGVTIDNETDAAREHHGAPCYSGVPAQVRTWIDALGGHCDEAPVAARTRRVAFTLPMVADDV